MVAAVSVSLCSCERACSRVCFFLFFCVLPINKCQMFFLFYLGEGGLGLGGELCVGYAEKVPYFRLSSVLFFDFVYIHVYQKVILVVESEVRVGKSVNNNNDKKNAQHGQKEKPCAAERKRSYVKGLDLDIIDHYTEQTTLKKKDRKQSIHRSKLLRSLCCNFRLLFFRGSANTNMRDDISVSVKCLLDLKLR